MHSLKHLRFNFSLFLLPVFLFALSESGQQDWLNTFLIFFVLHILVYPASNGYNSYMDKDTGSIGGLRHPPKTNKLLFYVTIFMDVAALLIAYFIHIEVFVLLILYILASKAYSYRKIRLKKDPFIGYLIVFVFQGAVVFLISHIAITQTSLFLSWESLVLPMLISSLLVGAGYPLTQIYQHKQDIDDNVVTISFVLGIKGTFIFSGIMLLGATLLFYFYFMGNHQFNYFLLYLILTLPTTIYFIIWFNKVRSSRLAANYTNTMKMNKISTVFLNLFFLFLVAHKIIL